eukprot:gnl/TRDRNA2_/TRDRNA2_91092_c0_seq1.p1 gnl/TRDRNA2_/TRDRNA2_91092_c0~~gnl/TRDRNA2_/TRDRNA2_91092_c0_seq1.p1  ORF type:complete len:304 (+),score=45.16 gnl/TRDRNA2_/TRDRNA2_91092_c0_seq1:65-976(+)
MGQQLAACGNCSTPDCCTGDRVIVFPLGIAVEQHYMLENRIGEGGYAVVRRCRERRSGAIRACKSTDKARETGLACARTEAEILQRLQRGRSEKGLVVRLVEIFEDQNWVHLVLELCAGGELYERQKEVGVFDEPEARVLMRQMLAAVRHVHRNGIVHRDLKLENWLLTRPAPGLELRLCDFGLSVILSPGEQVCERVGSVYYVAPEVLNGPYDSRADIWSLGVILYMLLSGLPPFNGPKSEAILAAVSHGQVKFEAPVWQRVAPPACELILQLLSRDASRRPTADAALSSNWVLGVCHVRMQ